MGGLLVGQFMLTGKEFASVRARGSHTRGVTVDGDVLCWGVKTRG